MSWHNKPIRSYVESGTFAHVIGYVGDITREELQVLYNKGYVTGASLGKSGIEKQYDDILRGSDGKSFRVVDVKEKGISGVSEVRVPPRRPGLNVVLTIDRTDPEARRAGAGARNGSVVVLKPSTGEVLAFVSYPSFDPNRFFAADSSDYFAKLSLDPSSPFLDRAIQSGISARLDIQDHHDHGHRRRRDDPDQSIGALHGEARVRRPHLQLLAEDGPRLRGPFRRSGAVLRRVFLDHGESPRSR